MYRFFYRYFDILPVAQFYFVPCCVCEVGIDEYLCVMCILDYECLLMPSNKLVRKNSSQRIACMHLAIIKSRQLVLCNWTFFSYLIDKTECNHNRPTEIKVCLHLLFQHAFSTECCIFEVWSNYIYFWNQDYVLSTCNAMCILLQVWTVSVNARISKYSFKPHTLVGNDESKFID